MMFRNFVVRWEDGLGKLASFRASFDRRRCGAAADHGQILGRRSLQCGRKTSHSGWLLRCSSARLSAFERQWRQRMRSERVCIKGYSSVQCK